MNRLLSSSRDHHAKLQQSKCCAHHTADLQPDLILHKQHLIPCREEEAVNEAELPPEEFEAKKKMMKQMRQQVSYKTLIEIFFSLCQECSIIIMGINNTACIATPSAPSHPPSPLAWCYATSAADHKSQATIALLSL